MKLSGLDDLCAHQHIYLSLSGGLDSMVMLDLLAHHPQIKSKLQAIHVNHGLSENADKWAEFCQQQCQERQIPCQVISIHLNSDHNLEAHARQKRYQALKKLTKVNDALVFAHHLDDQIETFFLQAVRGTGLVGLAAMPSFRDFDGRALYRPMLTISRAKLVAYAKKHKLAWIEDESNANCRFSRNFLRLQVLPLIETHWPHYRQALMQTIDSCQQQLVLRGEQQQQFTNPGVILNIHDLAGMEAAEVYAYLRSWFAANQVEEPARQVYAEIWQQCFVRKRQDSNPLICWGKWRLRYYAFKLYIQEHHEAKACYTGSWLNFPDKFGPWQASLSHQGLRLHPLIDQIEIRTRQGGERILYQGQHRLLKKLIQAWKIPPWERAHLALLYVNSELRAVLGYIIADQAHIPGDYQYYQIDNATKPP